MKNLPRRCTCHNFWSGGENLDVRHSAQDHYVCPHIAALLAGAKAVPDPAVNTRLSWTEAPTPPGQVQAEATTTEPKALTSKYLYEDDELLVTPPSF
jgi:hypothetical protein